MNTKMVDNSSFSRSSVFQKTVFVLTLAVFAVGFSTIGAADQEVSDCEELGSPGTTYNLTTNFTSQSDKCINITSSDVIFDGQDHLINMTGLGSLSAGIYVKDGVSNLTIRNLTVDGGYHNIYVDASEGTSIDDVLIEEVNLTYGYYSIRIREASNVTVRNSRLKTVKNGDAIQIDGNSHRLINNTIIQANNQGNGIEVLGSNESLVRNNNIMDSGTNGIYLRSSSHNNFTENTIKGASGNGILVDTSNDPHVSSNNRFEGNNLLNNSVGFRINDSDSFVVKDNYLKDNDGFGVNVSYTNESTFKNNTIESTDSATAALRLGLKGEDDASHGNDVLGNTFFNSSGNGVEIRADNTTFNDNNVSSNVNGTVFYDVNNTVAESNQINNNDLGVLIADSGINDNNTVRDGDIRANDVGIRIKDSSGDNTGNMFENVSLKNSSEFIDYESDETSNNFTDVDLYQGVNATIDGKNINLNSTGNSSIADIPDQQFSIGEYFNISNVSGEGWAQLNISYDDSVIQGINESNLSIQHYDGSDWTGIQDAGINPTKKLVYGNATSFSQFTVLGEGEPVINTSDIELDFGTVDSDEEETKTVEVTNAGKVNLTLTEVNITDADDSGEYSITDGNLGSDASDDINVTTSESHEIDVEFDPDNDDADNDAVLQIYSDDPDSEDVPVEVDLEGEGNNVSSGDDSDDDSDSGGSGLGSDDSSSDGASVSQVFFDPVAGEVNSVDVDEDKQDDIGVRKVSVTLSESKDSLDVDVEERDGKPDDVDEPSGTSYKYMDISTDASEDEIKNATVEFE